MKINTKVRGRRKTALRTKIVHHASAIPRGEWEKVFPQVMENYGFYKTLDESGFDQFDFHYVLIYENGKLALICPCFFMKFPLDTSINGTFRRLTNAIKRCVPDIFSLKALICGMPLGQGKIGLAPGASPQVMHALSERLDRIASRKRAAIIAFKDIGPEDVDKIAPLAAEGFHRIDGLPNMELDVDFKDFEDYLKTLNRSHRYDLRRKLKKVDGDVEISMEIKSVLDEDILREVYALYLQMVEKHDMGFEIVPVDFFRDISTNMPNETKYFLWRIDGKLAAFLFCLISGDVLMDYYVGLDYAVAHRYHLYFIKFRDVLEWCIEHGIKKYDMSITGYEPKRRLGFKPKRRYIYVKFRNRLIRPAFNRLSSLLKFENFDPELKKLTKEMNECAKTT